MFRIELFVVTTFVFFAAPALAQTPAGIPGVLAPGVVPELVKEGYQFTEGPVGTADGGLYFSDVVASRTYRLAADGAITLVREQTNGGNGLALNRDGELLIAEYDSKRLTLQARNGSIATLTESLNGKPFGAPNDLIVDAKNGVYFTDPGSRPVVPGQLTYVFYLPAGAKQPVVIDDQIARPNGLTLTPDGKTLIVDDTFGTTVFAFSLRRDGSVEAKKPFCQLRDIPAGQTSAADGMAIDRDGRVFISTRVGVQVFDRGGQYLGTIKVPRKPANMAFSGPDKSVLYITALEGLYRLTTLTRGPDRLGK